MSRLIIILLIMVSVPAWSQTQITWATLADVAFTEKFSEAEEMYYYFPHFGPSVKPLEGKEVYLKGFMLPLDPEKGVFILSRNPFAACFFCGGSGPESIVELELRPDHPEFEMDQIVTIKGKLVLNKLDIYRCNYILEDAVTFKSD